LAAAALSVSILNAQTGPQPLWPGARYTTEYRDQAIYRGMQFLYRTASKPKVFAEWGHDLLWCFWTISNTAQDPKLRQMAHDMGHERAAEWRRIHARLSPAKYDANDLCHAIFGADAADRLGYPDDRFKEKIRAAVARFDVRDFLAFDAANEPPPSDIPKACPKCDRDWPRGTKTCPRDHSPLRMKSRYDVWSDALITAYTGDIYGITLGAPYREVVKWIGVMRPYAPRSKVNTTEFYDITYCITHIVYTLNDYNQYRISPQWLPEEYAYLKTNLEEAIRLKDPETLGEFLDTLRAFGMTEDDALIRTGVDYVLSRQNPDGSWGNPKDRDVYNRYHSTWTAIDGLRQYAYQGERLGFPELMPLLRGATAPIGNRRAAWQAAPRGQKKLLGGGYFKILNKLL
jgi:hypothetical protein